MHSVITNHHFADHVNYRSGLLDAIGMASGLFAFDVEFLGCPQGHLMTLHTCAHIGTCLLPGKKQIRRQNHRAGQMAV